MRFVDSIYESYSANAKQKHQSFSPTAAILSQYGDGSNGVPRRTEFDDLTEKPPISPLKIVDLDDSIIRPPSEVESNRVERARNQIEPTGEGGRGAWRLRSRFRKLYHNIFSGITRDATKICIIAGIASCLLLTVLLAAILGPIRVPVIELSKGVLFKPLKGASFITETTNRLVFDGVMTIRSKVRNKNHLEMIIDRIQVHGFYVIKGAQRQSMKRNYIASGSHSLVEIPARSTTSLSIPLDIRYSSGKPITPIMQDILERHDEDRPLDIFFSFEVNYRVGGRTRKTTFAGRQQVTSPFTEMDIDRIRRNK